MWNRIWPVLAVCGVPPAIGAFDTPREQRHDDGPTTHAIQISDFTFQPATLSVSVGDTIVWRNRDVVPHTATADSATLDSGLIAGGQSWAFVAQHSGTMSYTCSFHPRMKGKLVVR